MDIEFKVGDLIIDPDSGSMGVLTERKRKIFIETTEAHYSMIHWLVGDCSYPYIEEKYLTICLKNGILKKQ